MSRQLKVEQFFLLGTTQWSPLKFSGSLRGTRRLDLQGWRIGQARNQQEIGIKQSRYVPSKCWLNLTRLHGVISQKIKFFTPTAVRTTNSIIKNWLHSMERKFIEWEMWLWIRSTINIQEPSHHATFSKIYWNTPRLAMQDNNIVCNMWNREHGCELRNSRARRDGQTSIDM
jgi:hypothetical protein